MKVPGRLRIETLLSMGVGVVMHVLLPISFLRLLERLKLLLDNFLLLSNISLDVGVVFVLTGETFFLSPERVPLDLVFELLIPIGHSLLESSILVEFLVLVFG